MSAKKINPAGHSDELMSVNKHPRLLIKINRSIFGPHLKIIAHQSLMINIDRKSNTVKFIPNQQKKGNF